jgi:hypothetical protein
MSGTSNLKALLAVTAVPLLYLAGTSSDVPGGLSLWQNAGAVVGAPLTPVSAAGVARRTTRRVVAAETTAATTAAAQQQQAATAAPQQAPPPAPAATPAPAPTSAPATTARPPGAPPTGTVVSALPAGCKPEVKDGVEYQNCGGVLYRAAFQGSTLVYVVQ